MPHPINSLATRGRSIDVRGARGNSRPYRDNGRGAAKSTPMEQTKFIAYGLSGIDGQADSRARDFGRRATLSYPEYAHCIPPITAQGRWPFQEAPRARLMLRSFLDPGPPYALLRREHL